MGTEIFKLHRQESVSASLHPQVLCSETAGGPVQEPAAMHRLEYRPDTAWLQHLNADGWDRDKVLEVATHFPQLKLQVPGRLLPAVGRLLPAVGLRLEGRGESGRVYGSSGTRI